MPHTPAAIDTNVPVIAKQGDDLDCRLLCIEFLEAVVAGKRGPILIDEGGEILGEYRRYLAASGQPTVGDLFYRHIIQKRGDRRFVLELDIPRDATTGQYEDFPIDSSLAGFDLSDRKFVAIAIKASGYVCNAVDSDWYDYREPLERSGCKIEFVCGCDGFQRR
jgi:hypothetical protein